MKSILCLGMNYHRYRTLFDRLSTEYRLFVSPFSEVPESPDGQIVHYNNGESLESAPEDSETAKAAVMLLHKKLNQKLGELENQKTEPQINPAMLASLYQRMMTTLAHERRFRNFFEREKVDALLVNASYISNVKSAVMLARENNIPVIELTHGNYTHNPPAAKWAHGNADVSVAYRFYSDHLILNDDIERQWFLDFPKNHLYMSNTKLHAVGSLFNLSVDDCDKQLSQSESRDRLGLADIPTVSLLTTWGGVRNIQAWGWQIEEALFYRDVFQALAKIQAKKNFQILIKPHPAFIQNDVFPGWKKFVSEEAGKCGLKNVSFYTTDLNKIIGASDLVISNAWTSVLWDSMLRGKPIYLHIPPVTAKTRISPEIAQESNEFHRRRIIRMVGSSQELNTALERDFEDLSQLDQTKQVMTLLEQLGIKEKSLDEKIEIFMSLLKDLIPQNSAGQSEQPLRAG